MARSSEDRAQVRVFPPWVLLATLLVGFGLHKFLPIEVDPGRAETWAEVLAALILMSAGLLMIWSLLCLRRSGQDPDPRTATPEIVETGPFRFSRNPVYLGMVLLCLGFAVESMSLWLLVLTPFAAWVLHRWVILPEERYLETKFGERYLAYRRRVRRWL